VILNAEFGVRNAEFKISMTHSAFRTPHSALSLIVAASENNVIGRGGELPWHLSADLRRFKQLTMGQAIIMGSKTWESIGRPLPGRTSIVLSRRPDWTPPGAVVSANLDSAIEAAARLPGDQHEVFVIGGSGVFRDALPRADCLYLTRVHADIEGDVMLPPIDWSEWRLTEESHHEADRQNDFAHTFQVWVRRR
jgi:dihydrofolate reductase